MREFSNFDLEYGGLIGMNLKCKVFLALVLAGLLLPLAGGVRDGGHASVLITMGFVIIAVMALRLWRRGEDIEADESGKKIGSLWPFLFLAAHPRPVVPPILGRPTETSGSHGGGRGMKCGADL
ncbi:MAG TPA: hypothetical protein HA349_11335 [Methanotrichaceae archaeon]|nr:hypothetical protein [Methanotrichaceae archaeon]